MRACLVAIVICAAPLAAAPLRIAVASNFQAAFALVEAGYAGELVATYGSSGLLYAQIVQGRPFDAFLSADRKRPMALVAAGSAVAPVTYAVGRLALLVNAGQPGPAWPTPAKRVAIANPATAPYGRAAVEVLAALGAAPRRINALNVSQAYHFAATGAADGAFVALAQVIARGVPAAGYWIPPERLHAPIEQVAVVLRAGDQAAARAFLGHLTSAPVQARLRGAGYR